MTPGTASCIQLWYSPEAPNTSQNLQQKKTSKNLQRIGKKPPRTLQINDGTDIISTRHNSQNDSQPAEPRKQGQRCLRWMASQKKRDDWKRSSDVRKCFRFGIPSWNHSRSTFSLWHVLFATFVSEPLRGGGMI